MSTVDGKNFTTNQQYCFSREGEEKSEGDKIFTISERTDLFIPSKKGGYEKVGFLEKGDLVVVNERYTQSTGWDPTPLRVCNKENISPYPNGQVRGAVAANALKILEGK